MSQRLQWQSATWKRQYDEVMFNMANVGVRVVFGVDDRLF
jgi:hypothetical protein